MATVAETLRQFNTTDEVFNLISQARSATPTLHPESVLVAIRRYYPDFWQIFGRILPKYGLSEFDNTLERIARSHQEYSLPMVVRESGPRLPQGLQHAKELAAGLPINIPHHVLPGMTESSLIVNTGEFFAPNFVQKVREEALGITQVSLARPVGKAILVPSFA